MLSTWLFIRHQFANINVLHLVLMRLEGIGLIFLEAWNGVNDYMWSLGMISSSFSASSLAKKRKNLNEPSQVSQTFLRDCCYLKSCKPFSCVFFFSYPLASSFKQDGISFDEIFWGYHERFGFPHSGCNACNSNPFFCDIAQCAPDFGVFRFANMYCYS